MSAIADQVERTKPVQVLFVLHNGFDTLDYVGPLEILVNAAHDSKNKDSTKAFRVRTAAPDGQNFVVKSSQSVLIKVDMDHEDAEAQLDEFDVLIVAGGGTKPILEATDEEHQQPIPLIKAWAALQEKDPSKERTLMSICTGSLFLAQAGVLQGLAATTHPRFYTDLEILCQKAAHADTGTGTDVQEERYVVNNARFDLGDDITENPFVFTKRPDGRKPSNARRGSEAFKASRRRESLVKRQSKPLSGLRVITSGGVVAGMDATLYLVAAMVSIESAEEVANNMCFTWQKGVCVEGIDV